MSSVDAATRAEIEELMARYCHRVDHADPEGWAALFTADGIFEVVGVMQMQGTEQLKAMPSTVTEHGAGTWRHQITNITTEQGSDPNIVHVEAYGLVTEWREGNKLVTFSDYRIELRRIGGVLRIAKLAATTAGMA